jgi:hypothetical protein
MTYPTRTQAIQAYLKTNMELIEDMEKGRIEINFYGKSLSIRTIEMSEEIKIESKNLTNFL